MHILTISGSLNPQSRSHVMARHFDEMSLIRAGYGFEQAVSNDIEFPEL